jgi:hypothetical protein
MDPLILLLIVVTSVLTILLVIVGVQVVMILRELKTTLVHVNHTLDTADNVVSALARPVSGLSDIAAGVKTGLKITEAFVSWISSKNHDDHARNKNQDDE